jgi:uncharacterized protein DUF6766
MRFVRENSLSLFFLTIFLLALTGQAIAGHAEYNSEQLAHMSEPISFWRYVVSSDFARAVTENWQSEYLQFSLYIGTTIWLFQRGSPESKPLGEIGRGTDEEQHVGSYAQSGTPAWARARGLKLWLFSNSLLLVMLTIWLGSWFAQSVAGWSAYNDEQLQHHEATVNWLGYIGSADFWESTLENWQSEFLQLTAFTVAAAYLVYKGSSESSDGGERIEAKLDVLLERAGIDAADVERDLPPKFQRR